MQSIVAYDKKIFCPRLTNFWVQDIMLQQSTLVMSLFFRKNFLWGDTSEALIYNGGKDGIVKHLLQRRHHLSRKLTVRGKEHSR